jgi:hypothetical protein
MSDSKTIVAIVPLIFGSTTAEKSHLGERPLYKWPTTTGFNGAQIPIGGHAELSPVQFDWSYAAVYDLKLVTDRGTAIEGEYASPASG